MSEKLNGVRAFWDKHALRSREAWLAYAAPAWFTAALPDCVLDGELVAGPYPYQLPAALRLIALKPGTPEHEAAWRGAKFMVFDAPAVSVPIEQRILVAGNLDLGAWAEPVTHTRCASRVALREFYYAVRARGGEGAMLREPGSCYEFERSRALVKIKPGEGEAALLAA
jgi:DNA ligase-1